MITIDGPIGWLPMIPVGLSYVAVFIVGMMVGGSD